MWSGLLIWQVIIYLSCVKLPHNSYPHDFIHGVVYMDQISCKCITPVEINKVVAKLIPGSSRNLSAYRPTWSWCVFSGEGSEFKTWVMQEENQALWCQIHDFSSHWSMYLSLSSSFCHLLLLPPDTTGCFSFLSLKSSLTTYKTHI